MKTNQLILIVVAIFLLSSCKKKTDPAPVVETIDPPFIASTDATLGVRVTSRFKQAFLEAGLYVSENPNPDQNIQAKFSLATDTGLYYSNVYGLKPYTKYYVKGYAINNSGEVKGSEISFTTTPTISDNDLNNISTVKIGTQTWMAENLKTTHFRNGDAIGTTIPSTLDISSETSPVYVWFADGISDSSRVYGDLYTWYTVTDTRGICPTGWHMPTDAEWTTLEDIFGGNLVAGSFLKEAGNHHWLSGYNKDANNMSCFSALAAGYRPATGTFALILNEAHFWSSTESETTKAWERMLSASSYSVTRQGADKKAGLSVRCIKD